MTTTKKARSARVLDPVLGAVRERRAIRDDAEVGLLKSVLDWAIEHTVDDLDDAATIIEAFGDAGLTLAGPGAPCVSEFDTYELAAALGMTSDSGKRYVGRALELRYRLPRIYARVMAGDLQVWKAGKIAHANPLPPRGGCHLCGPDARPDRAQGRYRPARPAGRRGTDQVRPRGSRTTPGRRSRGQVLRRLHRPPRVRGHRAGQRSARPLRRDRPQPRHPGRAYEIPDRIHDLVEMRDHHCVFPHCNRPARCCDTDHITPYAECHTTDSDDLAPLCRMHHRTKTHSAWAYYALTLGEYLWTNPRGLRFKTDHTGTTELDP